MMALAGRAAARIRETTGRQARTIAGFLNAAESNSVVLGRESLVVVDEASMLDLPTMYRILRHLPEGCRLLLVGDPGQLPPIGFGLGIVQK
jgi:exodeoxyribonuclease V alpha subunit